MELTRSCGNTQASMRFSSQCVFVMHDGLCVCLLVCVRAILTGLLIGQLRLGGVSAIILINLFGVVKRWGWGNTVEKESK